ncbi:uncharacterized protein LOC111074930 isoform X1 [Drosophila obscura]|uniref:uncharacterized protein LOC111074930 isoform X1 n=1 Tax=Drosophila obscura TaxID=7282 RepID=UPI001BB21C9F|nr:uncharacterized protein LOC111074930 isoform X1 [Drosophila obscura]XP_022223631.2 uncharacterized protein LOC111074930 isoform X1 [Drosophila obscura]XP_022223632.2 uncharacterized protein LOC111074930 isoform X1 [Drosophila obscura]
MNGARKSKCLKTVRLGDLLYDEQKRLLMLCRSCEHYFLTFQMFQKHLADCSGVKHVVNCTDPLSYVEDKRETRLTNGRQELHIYNIEDVNSSAIDWEAELEDPRWYDDETRLSAHSKPKTSHSKENVVGKKQLVIEKNKNPQIATTKTVRRRQSPSQTHPAKRINTEALSVPCHTHPAKRMNTEALSVPRVMENLKRLVATDTEVQPSPAAANGGEGTTKEATTNTTQQILSKLRACGVDVKRSKTQVIPTPTLDPNLEKKQKTLEIMRKLQSKGIQCTKIKGECNAPSTTEQLSTQRLRGEYPEPTEKSNPKQIAKEYNAQTITDAPCSIRAESTIPKIKKGYNAPKIKKISYAP